MVHTPEAFPDVSIGYIVHAQQNSISRISVSVSQVKADDSLNHFNQRNHKKCFMYNTAVTVGNDPFSENIAEDTCYSKCRLKAIYKMCNCTQYFFKSYKGIVIYGIVGLRLYNHYLNKIKTIKIIDILRLVAYLPDEYCVTRGKRRFLAIIESVLRQHIMS